VAAYVECLPSQTFAESCVYHGERGCGLPSEMRAATCNDFYCEELHHLRQGLDEGSLLRAFFVSVDEVSISAMKFVDAVESTKELDSP
jgi:hypothetical protein